MDVLQALRSLEGEEAFDCIFMDPPYNKDLERQVLEYLKDSSLANTDTLIVTEADLHTDFSYVEELGYELSRSKEYKTNKHIFLHKSSIFVCQNLLFRTSEIFCKLFLCFEYISWQIIWILQIKISVIS